VLVRRPSAGPVTVRIGIHL